MRLAVIEDDRGWEEYYRDVLGYDDGIKELRFFRDGVVAVQAMDEWVPDVVILDVLLTGPTGFAVLNEMRSYEELMKVPVIIVSSVEVGEDIAAEYGVVKALDKSLMTPQELLGAIREVRSKDGE
ncbi:response regulator [Candidatus Saccharibacteria bacterium]|nr:response regulator [Candidatus Saccharibacteria bacterium]